MVGGGGGSDQDLSSKSVCSPLEQANRRLDSADGGGVLCQSTVDVSCGCRRSGASMNHRRRWLEDSLVRLTS